VDKKISAWLLIVFGGFGPLLTIISIFRPPTTPIYLRSILFLVGLVAVALGVQRLSSIQEILEFVKRRKLIWLKSEEDVYAQAKKMIRYCEDDDCIRATDLLPYEKTEEFTTYFSSIAAKMRSMGLIYRLVAALEPAGVRPDHSYGRNGLDRRYEIVSKNSPESHDKMEVRCVDRTFPLEILIVRDRVVLGFPSLSRDHKVTRGILVEDKEVAEQFREWYDNQLFGSATKWDRAPVVGALKDA
jgi:hypothetical protein